MLKHIRDKFQIRKTDNKGSAIVMVIIAIAFVGMLVAMIVYMAYMNYLMKFTDRSAKNNFYTAESALDEINVGLQTDISYAMTNAYSEAMKSGSTLSESEQKELFEQKYKDSLYEVLNPKDGSSNRSQDAFMKHLRSYWKETPVKGVTLNGAGPDKITYGAELSTKLTNYYYQDDDYIYLYDIKIVYTNEEGFVSVIETDIVLSIPDIEFAANTEKPEIQLYSIIANNNLITSGKEVTISGSVYGGQEGIQAKDSGTIHFDYLPTDTTGSTFSVTAESLNATNGAKITNAKHQMWVKNINVTTSDIDLGGSVFVQDDLNIDGVKKSTGDGSVVTLRGSYFGYGDAAASAENSSSILINGANTTLDLSGLTSFMLAGHAYVGARHYNPSSTVSGNDYFDNPDDPKNAENINTETGLPSNQTDIVLGQSIATKSDQLIYMVPKECMCYDTETDTQVLAKNPLTYDEYLKYTASFIPKKNAAGEVEKDAAGNILYTNDLKYKVVDLAKTFGVLDSSLQAKYGVTYQPVFRKVSGNVLVYYYLFFESDNQANAFFRDYYEKDPDTINNYAKGYIKSITYNKQLGVNTTGPNPTFLSLAGNLLYEDNGQYKVREDTVNSDLTYYDSLVEQRDNYANTFKGLSHFLLKNASSLTTSQLNNDVYTNLVVDEATFTSFVPKGSSILYKRDPDLEAIAVNNADGDPYLVSTHATVGKTKNTTSVIIASGDVIIDVTDFKGLIIAGGDVSIGGTCNSVTYDADKAIQCMLCKYGDNCFYELLQNGISYANITGLPTGSAEEAAAEGAREKDYVVLGDLVQYDNWRKE